MTSALQSEKSLRKHWTFYWRPYWKGIVWLICFLGLSATFTWLKSLFYVSYPLYSSVPRLYRIPVMLLDPFIWLSALLSWRALHKNGWVMDDASGSRRRVFFKGYLANALSLFVLIFIARTIMSANSFIMDPFFCVGWRSISTLKLINYMSFACVIDLSYACVVSLGVPMFLFVTVTYIPRERGKLTAIILPAMLTILLHETAFYLAMHSTILLSTRKRFHILSMYDPWLYQLCIALPLIFALGYFVVKRPS